MRWFALFILGLSTFGCRRHPPSGAPTPIVLLGHAMGSNWSIKIDRPPNQPVDVLQSSVAALLEKLESQMSNYRDDSDLSRFNQTRSTDWVSVPAELAEVINLAQEVSAQSNGAFDITVAPFVDLWGFGSRPSRKRAVPADPEIAAARSHVGYRKLDVRLHPPALRKSDPLLRIDLGAIVKGYAADKVGEYLDSQRAADYLVAIAGELRAKGRTRIVGIETPTPDVRRIFEEFHLTNESLSTSGNYRNFFDSGGKRYGHEIDPRTGRPIESPLASVSVANASGARADAWATALIVLGSQEGSATASRLSLQALFILRGQAQFETRRTDGFGNARSSSPVPP